MIPALTLALLAGAPSDAVATIQEWDVPTARSKPHDPARAPDGSLWFTEQAGNKLGRLDPRSGHVDEFPLPVSGSGPHGLVADRDGNIWFTAISKGFIGRLDPGTGAGKSYPMPGHDVDPHTPA